MKLEEFQMPRPDDGEGGGGSPKHRFNVMMAGLIWYFYNQPEENIRNNAFWDALVVQDTIEPAVVEALIDWAREELNKTGITPQGGYNMLDSLLYAKRAFKSYYDSERGDLMDAIVSYVAVNSDNMYKHYKG